MIGDKLREERERQNLTIQDIEQGTSIRALYIECIEKGDYDSLPGEVYAKGFVRNYASFLKLDAGAIVAEFNAERRPKSEAVQPTAARPAREEKPKAKKSPFSTGSDFHKRVELSHRRQNLFLLLSLIFLIIGVGIAFISSGEEEKSPMQVAAESQREEKAAPAAPAAATEVELTAKFTERSWTEVTVDGQVVFSDIIASGETRTWKGKDKITIATGNAGYVLLTVNGKDMGAAGKVGETVERTFTLADVNGKAEEKAAAPASAAPAAAPATETRQETRQESYEAAPAPEPAPEPAAESAPEPAAESTPAAVESAPAQEAAPAPVPTKEDKKR